MVLAIGATIRSRQLKVLLSAEGYCASAIVHLDTIFQKSSVRGVQCMLLLQMYTFHNPSSAISLWTLHYHCLAHVLELGLHRNFRGSAFTEFDQEMRTRVFWCVYTMDRYLCTSLGRAIGIMDEQCDLRVSCASPTVTVREKTLIIITVTTRHQRRGPTTRSTDPDSTILYNNNRHVQRNPPL